MRHYIYVAVVGVAFAVAVVLLNRKFGWVDSLLAKVGQ